MDPQILEKIRTVKRINVIGSSGSGKTEFSKRLSKALKLPFIEMDSLHWEADWKEATTEQLVKKVEERFMENEWVLDGNYNKMRDHKWKDVQLVIWLDYPFHINLYRILKRTIGRAITGEEIWKGTGNKESFRMSFFSRKSVILWLFNSYWRTKRGYIRMLKENHHPQIEFKHIKDPRVADRFIEQISNSHLNV